MENNSIVKKINQVVLTPTENGKMSAGVYFENDQGLFLSEITDLEGEVLVNTESNGYRDPINNSIVRDQKITLSYEGIKRVVPSKNEVVMKITLLAKKMTIGEVEEKLGHKVILVDKDVKN